MIRRWTNKFNTVEIQELYPNNFIIRKNFTGAWLPIIDLDSWEKIEKLYVSNGYLEYELHTMRTLLDKGLANTLITGTPIKFIAQITLPSNCEFINQTTCAHEWKFYEGIIETYNYCILCNEKSYT